MNAAGGIDVDVAVIGGGPAGYTAALRSAERGLSTVLVERGAVGGTCLNVGCIPSKAVIHAADTFHQAGHAAAMGITVDGRRIDLAATMRWKETVLDRLRAGVEGQLARGSVTVVTAEAELLDHRTVRTSNGDDVGTITARSIVLATGARPVELPHLPFGGRVLSSTDALALTTVPDRLVVIGAGYIGLELGTALAKAGATVTFVEQSESILPSFDASLGRPVRRRLAELGATVLTSTFATGADADGVTVRGPDGQTTRLSADAVLVTVGRRPVTEGLGLERLGIAMDGRAIRVDERCRTSVAGVYAIGDVTGEPMLAHRGIAQGELVAEVLGGDDVVWGYLAIPSVCFTDPEIFSVGLSRSDAERLHGRDRIRAGRSTFTTNGRALTLGDEMGSVEVVADVANGIVLGIHAVGSDVAELAAAASLAVEMAATLEDLAGTVIAHPTLGEALHEATAAARGPGHGRLVG